MKKTAAAERKAADYWKQKYLDSLIQAAGAAYILQLHDEADRLHKMSAKAMQQGTKRH